MQILPALIAVMAPALCTLTGFEFRKELVFEKMNSSVLMIEENYDHMAYQIRSAIFSGLDSSSEVSQEQVDTVVRNVDFVLGKFKSQPARETSVTDDAFSVALHELFLNNFLSKIQSASVGDVHKAFDILALYDRCLQSAELHGVVPHTAFPFSLASNKLVNLLRLMDWTSSLEHGAVVESIGGTLDRIRELFESVDTISICSGSFIPSLTSLRGQFVKECRLFFSIVPEEYSSMYPDIVMNAFNAFRMLENMLSMAVSIALLPEEGQELLDDVVEMTKAHVVHVVVGCVKRSVPTDILVKNLTSGPGRWYRRIPSSIRDYVFSTYPQDIYPDHAVSILRPVIDTPSDSSLVDVETEQVEVKESTPSEVTPSEVMPSEAVSEKPSRMYRNFVFALLGLATVGTLTSIPLYFLRRKSHD